MRHSVLLVEDDDVLRALYGFVLANCGYKVTGVRNGADALAELQAYRPDVILTDLAIPGPDGVTLIRIIKSKAELADIPLIAMTAYGHNLLSLANSAGADLAVEKPVDVKTLCDLVTSVLPQP